MVEDGSSDASHEQRPKAAPAVRAQHDKIGIPVHRRFDEPMGWVAGQARFATSDAARSDEVEPSTPKRTFISNLFVRLASVSALGDLRPTMSPCGRMAAMAADRP